MGMRRVLGGRKPSLLRPLEAELPNGLQEADGEESLARPASVPGGPTRWAYLTAWTRLMQVGLVDKPVGFMIGPSLHACLSQISVCLAHYEIWEYC